MADTTVPHPFVMYVELLWGSRQPMTDRLATSSVVTGGGQMGATAPPPTGTRPGRGIHENPMRKNGVGWGVGE